MKGFIASALLGVLLASPVAAQIAGSGKRTPEAEAQLAKIRKTPPKPVAAVSPWGGRVCASWKQRKHPAAGAAR